MSLSGNVSYIVVSFASITLFYAFPNEANLVDIVLSKDRSSGDFDSYRGNMRNVNRFTIYRPQESILQSKQAGRPLP